MHAANLGSRNLLRHPSQNCTYTDRGLYRHLRLSQKKGAKRRQQIYFLKPRACMVSRYRLTSVFRKYLRRRRREPTNFNNPRRE